MSKKDRRDFRNNPYDTKNDLYSNGPKAKRKLSTTRKVVNIVVISLSILALLVGGGCMYVEGMISKMIFREDPEESTPAASQTSGQTDPENSNISLGDPVSARGLYHDDAVMNILLLGVDDYQANDKGRSDSQMLLTIDTRHQKIKLTSFMRDMYVQIPGHSANRVNVAWSLGEAPLTVKTLESSFGVDIDRYVIVDFSDFTDIVDTLGGVDLEITQGEADLVNQYSGETKYRLTAGQQTLTGKQARYYSRIRAIGNDQGRTERQRKVVMNLVEKMKSKDIFTINSALSKILGLITTNMSKNEVLALASNIMTYLNYPMSQFRVPDEGTYEDMYVYIGGSKAAVLGVDFQENSQRLVKFLYEDDIPSRIQ